MINPQTDFERSYEQGHRDGVKDGKESIARFLEAQHWNDTMVTMNYAAWRMYVIVRKLINPDEEMPGDVPEGWGIQPAGEIK